MTVTATNTRTAGAAGNSSTVAYSFDFRLAGAGELEVITVLDSTGAETVLASSAYSIAYSSEAYSGTVTLASAAGAGRTVYIRRKSEQEQEANLRNQGGQLKETIEDALDRLALVDQELGAQINRSLRLPWSQDEFDPLAASSLPGRIAGFDEDGAPTTYSLPSGAYSSPAAGRVAIGARRAGTVLMLKDSVPSTDTAPDWIVYTAAGSAVSIASSVTDGLAEALQAAQDGFTNLVVEGGGRQTDFGSINSIACSSAFAWPALDVTQVDLRTSIISGNAATIGSGDAFMTIRSAAITDIHLDTQITADHDGPTVLIRPSNTYGYDAHARWGVVTAFIRQMQNLVTSSAARVLKINPQAGEAIDRSTLHVQELNGGAVALEILAASTGVIDGNDLHFNGIHGFGTTGAEIQISNDAQFTGNRVFLGFAIDTTPTTGAKIGGVRNAYTIDMIGTAPTTGLAIQSGAQKNDIHILNLVGSTLATDASDKSNAIHLPGRWVVEVDRNGTNQTGIADNTFTKVEHTTERYDTYAAYDNATNYRATIAVPGWYDIEVGSAWVTGEDVLEIHNAIYKNGSVVRSASTQVGGNAGNIGGPPLRCMLYLAKDDYVEHFVLHNGTGTRDLLGAVARTYMVIRRID